MLRFHKGTYLCILFKSILLETAIDKQPIRFRCFTVYRICKYSFHFSIGTLLNSLNCYMLYQ